MDFAIAVAARRRRSGIRLRKLFDHDTQVLVRQLSAEWLIHEAAGTGLREIIPAIACP